MQYLKSCTITDNNFIVLQINTISSDTLQMQLEYKSILKASFEKMTSPSVASAMGYEMVGKVTVPVESVFLGTGNLQDKIRPIPYTVCITH